MVETDWLACFEEYLVGLGMAPATIANYLADIRSFSDWLPGSHLSNAFILGVDGDHVRRYCQSLRLQGRSASTINRRLQAVRKFYDFAVHMGWSSHNPAREVDRFSENPAVPPRVLTGDEARRLMRAIGDGMGAISRRDRAILGLLLLNSLIMVIYLCTQALSRLNAASFSLSPTLACSKA